jgi:hypothetical protein
MGRWLAMWLGLFGTYRKHETIDLQFQRSGRTQLASDLPVKPEGAESAGGAEGRTTGM